MRYLFLCLFLIPGNSALAQSYSCSPRIECNNIFEACTETDYHDQINVIDFSETAITYHDEIYGPVEIPVISTAKMDNHISYFLSFGDISILATIYDDGTLIAYAPNVSNMGRAGAVTFSCEALQ